MARDEGLELADWFRSKRVRLEALKVHRDDHALLRLKSGELRRFYDERGAQADAPLRKANRSC